MAAGYGAMVLDTAKLLNAVHFAEPYIKLVCGYAAHSLGDYFAGRADLSRAYAGWSNFGPVDRYILNSLIIECDYKIGRIGNDEYALKSGHSVAILPILPNCSKVGCHALCWKK